MYQIQVKHDTRHRKWHTLSVRIREPLSAVGSAHAAQWAIDNQANVDQVAFALVNTKTAERIEHMSNARMNRNG